MNLYASFGFIPCCLSVPLIVLSIFFWFSTQRFIDKAKQTKGTIVDIELNADLTGIGYYFVIKFKTIDGQEFQTNSRVRTKYARSKVGQVVDILYDPANPNDARIDSIMNLYSMPITLGGAGIIFLCTSIMFAMIMLIGTSGL